MRTKIDLSPQKKEIIKGVPKRLTKNMELKRREIAKCM